MAGPTFDASLALEFMGFTGPEVKEGMTALMEKRRPKLIPRIRSDNRVTRSKLASAPHPVHLDATATCVARSNFQRSGAMRPYVRALFVVSALQLGANSGSAVAQSADVQEPAEKKATDTKKPVDGKATDAKKPVDDKKETDAKKPEETKEAGDGKKPEGAKKGAEGKKPAVYRSAEIYQSSAGVSRHEIRHRRLRIGRVSHR